MKSPAKCHDSLRSHIETVPLVDCHDHSMECGPKYEDAIQVIVNSYFVSDLIGASSEADVGKLNDAKLSVEDRWPILEKAWKRTCHTGYAQVARRVLQEFYDEDELTLDALKRVGQRLVKVEDEDVYVGILDKSNIAVRIVNNCPDVKAVLDGSLKLAPRSKPVIGLPGYHSIKSHAEVRQLMAPLKRTVTSLGEYLDACREIFKGFRKFGAIAFKDQSAYSRPLDYGNPSRAAAEEVFNWFMSDPRRVAAYPDGVKPLDDYLFHEFLRMARDMDFPVQIHTGHMAGIRNDIAKTNAVLMTPVFELHRDVRFDLFHANWPYSGELLYLCKNFPNVSIDFCWTNIIDPVYCQQMFKQALSSVPHGKIHGYGTDMGGRVDWAWGHAAIARDNIAIALAEMVEMEYLSLDEAKEVAHAWLFGNANEFFRLGL
ncbi:MAG: hypothetical protein AUJ92_05940 [Armatimonadetes bacterium CG2_30_59_28]|nr:amidohydrolase family protein [Armatimonadota bacterium]OIO96472.1 MAG: hypothetical protein AUJ92_05940 [Armatimonadetes bacterium CG2_30_59_28]PIU67025.1 MAG: hypothetical protein COS85_02350 [Armatimonadetes bacterium CG07_land_8_20_14_0_80_59_28]PIX44047.1 MAG: hypothetical protein COZ56_05695 [Armatimonadetes bacterium CG_4_8_14_3_um_filter_58_9]